MVIGGWKKLEKREKAVFCQLGYTPICILGECQRVGTHSQDG